MAQDHWSSSAQILNATAAMAKPTIGTKSQYTGPTLLMRRHSRDGAWTTTGQAPTSLRHVPGRASCKQGPAGAGLAQRTAAPLRLRTVWSGHRVARWPPRRWTAAAGLVREWAGAGLAQSVEQRFCKPKVAGSTPASGTILRTSQTFEPGCLTGRDSPGSATYPAPRLWAYPGISEHFRARGFPGGI